MTCYLCGKRDSAMAGMLWCQKCAIWLSRPHNRYVAPGGGRNA